MWCQAYLPIDHPYHHDVTNNVSESRNASFKRHALLHGIELWSESGLMRLFQAIYDDAKSNLREAEEAQQNRINLDAGLLQATVNQIGVKRATVDQL